MFRNFFRIKHGKYNTLFYHSMLLSLTTKEVQMGYARKTLESIIKYYNYDNQFSRLECKNDVSVQYLIRDITSDLLFHPLL